MPGGGPTIATYQKAPTGGLLPGDVLADQGLSLNPAPPAGKVEVEFGDRLGANTFNSRLTTNRQLDLNGFAILLDIFGNSVSPGGSFEAVGIGQDPGTGINGMNINVDYTGFPVGTYGLMGFGINAFDLTTNCAWFRGINNDSFVFGNTFVNSAGPEPAARMIIFDSGNVTFNSEAGTYPQSNDIDTGYNFGFFGLVASLDSGGSGRAAYMTGSDAMFTSLETAIDFSATSVGYTIENSTNSFHILGVNDPSVPYDGDFFILEMVSGFSTKGNLTFLGSGSVLLQNGDSSAASDSGDLWQVFGNISTIPNAAESVQGCIKNNASQFVQAGSVSGNITASQPEQGGSYKKVIIWAGALDGNATYNFPTAFVNTPVAIFTGAGLSVTSLTTALATVHAAAATSGWVIIEGY